MIASLDQKTAVQRLDLALVARGLAASRREAQALIMSGRVSVDGHREDKPGHRVADAAAIAVTGPPRPFVGRGGIKLAGALDRFGIDVAGLVAVDIGASTGGFTDCLLQRGAARVYAVDVGHGQIDWSLRNDPRVMVLEGVNARYLSPADLPAPAGGIDLAVIDVSFISLRLVLPRVPPLLGTGRDPAGIVALVKPQFEVGKGKVGRGGIVRSPEDRRRVILEIAACARPIGLKIAAMARSPISGAEGNIEYFMHLTTGSNGLTSQEIEEHALSLTQEEHD